MSVKEIYNEGRVVGLSAYEVYVRHHLSENPETPPASEIEWLSSMLGSGSSILIKLSNETVVKQKNNENTSLQVHQIKIPKTSRLCACATIVGSLFFGEGEGGPVCTRVNDYGYVIDNSKALQPDNYKSSESPIQIDRIKEYAKIVDGGIVLSKNFFDSGLTNPKYDLKPDVSSDAYIRIFMKEAIENPIYILLTGFTQKAVIYGMVGLDGSTNTVSPQDGDFLGPAVYPWANKIVFSIPPAFAAYYSTGAYTRMLYQDVGLHQNEIEVNDTPVIDMRHNTPDEYYRNRGDSASPVDGEVTELYVSGDGASVLTVFSYDGTKLPAALFGSYVTEIGENDIYPLDCYAPGTVRMYPNTDQGKEDAKNRQDLVPGNYSIIKDEKTGEMFTYDDQGNLKPIAKTYVTRINNKLETHVEAGKHHTKSISLTDENEKDLPTTSRNAFDSNSPELGDKPITWARLLEMLSTDKGLDILGANLRKLRTKLPNIDTSEIGKGVLNLTGTSESKVGGGFTAGGRIKSGTNYFEFGNGLRLYISSTQPTDSDVPVGSIGIGWTD